MNLTPKSVPPHSVTPPVVDLDALPDPMSPDAALEAKVATMVNRVQTLPNPVLAFSGGVDSAVVAALLARTHGDRARLVTAVGPSLSARQRAIAARVAAELGLPHDWIATHEGSDPSYRRNDAQRCFHCKSHLYETLRAFAQDHPDSVLLSGTNFDDQHDYRPGLLAATQFHVVAPLADAKVSKAEVRRLAREWNLSVHDLPAAPCLASRIAYGVEVTPERLSTIEAAESLLWEAGFSDVRVRLLPENVARIEVPLPEVARLQPDCSGTSYALLDQILRLGFDTVTVDPQGLRSGNLNSALPNPRLPHSKSLPILP